MAYGGPKDEHGLTLKQRRFVDAYMGEANGNATEAARMAGYSQSSPAVTQHAGHEVLRNPNVRSEIERIYSSRVASRAERQAFWTDTMRSGAHEMGHRLKATELLGKTQGDFIARLEVDVKVDAVELTDAQLAAIAEKAHRKALAAANSVDAEFEEIGTENGDTPVLSSDS